MIGSKPMIQWVYENSIRSKLVTEIIIATDDERILDCAKSFGAKAILTSENHPSGTDRIIEVCNKVSDYNYIINIQGDEPGIEYELIDGVIDLKIKNPDWEMTTACVKIKDEGELKDPNKVKVVFNNYNKALYFSRATIPFPFKKTSDTYRHLGIYCYNKKALLEYNSLPKSSWEETESLEQLRGLQNGYSIGVYVAEKASLAIDTPEDKLAVEKEFRTKNLIH
jgi:3-deoxy-manno-octulosonate cytidylyltransferase (CMP-KDO synthetase)